MKTNSPSARIELDGLTAYLTPPVESVVEMLREAAQRIPTTDYYCAGEWVVPLPWFRAARGRQSYAFPTGWFHNVVGWLVDAGWRVHTRHVPTQYRSLPLIGMRPCPPALEMIASAAGREQELLRRIVSITHGIIPTSSRTETVPTIGRIARLFPAARIVITATSHAALDSIRGAVAVEVSEPVNHHLVDDTRGRTRCTLMTTALLRNLSPTECEIVIFLDAKDVLHSWSRAGVSWLSQIRVYGFLADYGALSLNEQMTVSAYLGPHLLAASVSESRCRLQVVLVEAPRFNGAISQNPLARKRQCLWGNHERNWMIADLARSIAQGDWSALTQMTDERWDTVSEIATPQVAIVVESTEHGRALQKLIPGAPLRSHSTSPRQRGKRADDSDTSRLLIVTSVAAQEGGLHPDIVIRASGEADTKLCSSRGRATSENCDIAGQLLIDIGDAFDRRAQKETAERRAHYERIGWNVA